MQKLFEILVLDMELEKYEKEKKGRELQLSLHLSQVNLLKIRM